MAFTKRPQPHIVLYRGEEVINRHAWSPFVVKLETRLRMSGLAYKTDFGSFQEAPKGKVPYVRVWWDEKSSSGNEKSQDESKDMDKNAADMIPDSTIIIKRFVGEGLLEDLNANLGPADQAYDLALRALLEDKFYFLQVCCIVTNCFTFEGHLIGKTNVVSLFRRSSCGTIMFPNFVTIIFLGYHFPSAICSHI